MKRLTHKGWLVALRSRFSVLHFSARVERERVDWWDTADEYGARLLRSACGRKMRLQIPGLGARLSAPRCERCCASLGIEGGNGTPANEAPRSPRQTEGAST